MRAPSPTSPAATPSPAIDGAAALVARPSPSADGAADSVVPAPCDGAPVSAAPPAPPGDGASVPQVPAPCDGPGPVAPASVHDVQEDMSESDSEVVFVREVLVPEIQITGSYTHAQAAALRPGIVKQEPNWVRMSTSEAVAAAVRAGGVTVTVQDGRVCADFGPVKQSDQEACWSALMGTSRLVMLSIPVLHVFSACTHFDFKAL